MLRNIPARSFDERVAEYPYLVSWLLDRKRGDALLDVGCVLNNKLVTDILHTCVKELWFSNVDLEPLKVSSPVYYHISSLVEAFPNGQQFSLVTCLSTIEHIGYDNSQYGSSIPGKYTSVNEEPLIESLTKITQIMAPGGYMLVSVPFGYREVLIHPVTGKIASQGFDASAIQKGIQAMEREGISVDFEVFQATAEGWVPVEPAACNARYADGCPAAAAVAFIKGHRKEQP